MAYVRAGVVIGSPDERRVFKARFATRTALISGGELVNTVSGKGVVGSIGVTVRLSGGEIDSNETRLRTFTGSDG